MSPYELARPQFTVSVEPERFNGFFLAHQDRHDVLNKDPIARAMAWDVLKPITEAMSELGAGATPEIVHIIRYNSPAGEDFVPPDARVSHWHRDPSGRHIYDVAISDVLPTEYLQGTLEPKTGVFVDSVSIITHDEYAAFAADDRNNLEVVSAEPYQGAIFDESVLHRIPEKTQASITSRNLLIGRYSLNQAITL